MSLLDGWWLGEPPACGGLGQSLSLSLCGSNPGRDPRGRIVVRAPPPRPERGRRRALEDGRPSARAAAGWLTKVGVH